MERPRGGGDDHHHFPQRTSGNPMDPLGSGGHAHVKQATVPPIIQTQSSSSSSQVSFLETYSNLIFVLHVLLYSFILFFALRIVARRFKAWVLVSLGKIGGYLSSFGSRPQKTE